MDVVFRSTCLYLWLTDGKIQGFEYDDLQYGALGVTAGQVYANGAPYLEHLYALHQTCDLTCRISQLRVTVLCYCVNKTDLAVLKYVESVSQLRNLAVASLYPLALCSPCLLVLLLTGYWYPTYLKAHVPQPNVYLGKRPPSPPHVQMACVHLLKGLYCSAP